MVWCLAHAFRNNIISVDRAQRILTTITSPALKLRVSWRASAPPPPPPKKKTPCTNSHHRVPYQVAARILLLYHDYLYQGYLADDLARELRSSAGGLACGEQVSVAVLELYAVSRIIYMHERFFLKVDQSILLEYFCRLRPRVVDGYSVEVSWAGE